MPQSNELRVFISSTFRDLQEEREHLIKKIFPEIRALCRDRGIRFTEWITMYIDSRSQLDMHKLSA